MLCPLLTQYTPPNSSELSPFYRLFFLPLLLLLFSYQTNARGTSLLPETGPANALVPVCDAPPDRNPICNPPNTYDVVINLEGETLVWDICNSTPLGPCQSFTQVAKITGCGTVLVPNSLNLQLLVAMPFWLSMVLIWS